jgi:hypothetical protein
MQLLRTQLPLVGGEVWTGPSFELVLHPTAPLHCMPVRGTMFKTRPAQHNGRRIGSA